MRNISSIVISFIALFSITLTALNIGMAIGYTISHNRFIADSNNASAPGVSAPRFEGIDEMTAYTIFLFGDDARALCGPEPPVLCGEGMELGCDQNIAAWACY